MQIYANGISMNYELTGRGRCLTLIHGAGDNLNAWYQQVPVFSRRYKVLAYDVRGHGQTELPDGELSVELWAQDLHALLKALKINEIILLGFSLGARIAVQFTLTHPEVVKALILSNGGGSPPRRTEEEMRQMAAFMQAQLEAVQREGMQAVARDRLATAFSPGFAEKNPRTAERYKEILLQNDPKGYIRVMQSMGHPSPPPELRRISCPTILIAGEHDLLGGVEPASMAQQAIRGSQLKVFPTGHPTPLEQPEAFNKAVLDFLAVVGFGEGQRLRFRRRV